MPEHPATEKAIHERYSSTNTQIAQEAEKARVQIDELKHETKWLRS
jgi:hypothetical protein